jgi:hypothetical protein
VERRSRPRRGAALPRVQLLVERDARPQPSRSWSHGSIGTFAALRGVTKQKIEVRPLPTVADLRAKRLELRRASLRERLPQGDLDDVRVVVERRGAARLDRRHRGRDEEGDASRTESPGAARSRNLNLQFLGDSSPEASAESAPGYDFDSSA